MNTNVPKFDLIVSMMERLNVSPSVLTMNWLQEQELSFVHVIQRLCQGNQGFCPDTISLALAQEKQLDSTPTELHAETNVPTASVSQRQDLKHTSLTDVVSEETVFYDEDWQKLPDVCELNAETLFSARCGMFAYLQGEKVIVSKTLLSRKQSVKMRSDFAGVLFSRQENKLHVLRVCMPYCGHRNAVAKMPPNYRFPNYEDCEKIFIYKNILHKAFIKQQHNFGGMENLFYEEPDCPDKTVCVFNLTKGTKGTLPAKSAVASSCCVRVLNIN